MKGAAFHPLADAADATEKVLASMRSVPGRDGGERGLAYRQVAA
jgi:hypothetical protein